MCELAPSMTSFLLQAEEDFAKLRSRSSSRPPAPPLPSRVRDRSRAREDCGGNGYPSRGTLTPRVSHTLVSRCEDQSFDAGENRRLEAQGRVGAHVNEARDQLDVQAKLMLGLDRKLKALDCRLRDLEAGAALGASDIAQKALKSHTGPTEETLWKVVVSRLELLETQIKEQAERIRRAERFRDDVKTNANQMGKDIAGELLRGPVIELVEQRTRGLEFELRSAVAKQLKTLHDVRQNWDEKLQCLAPVNNANSVEKIDLAACMRGFVSPNRGPQTTTPLASPTTNVFAHPTGSAIESVAVAVEARSRDEERKCWDAVQTLAQRVGGLELEADGLCGDINRERDLVKQQLERLERQAVNGLQSAKDSLRDDPVSRKETTICSDLGRPPAQPVQHHPQAPETGTKASERLGVRRPGGVVQDEAARRQYGPMSPMSRSTASPASTRPFGIPKVSHVGFSPGAPPPLSSATSNVRPADATPSVSECESPLHSALCQVDSEQANSPQPRQPITRWNFQGSDDAQCVKQDSHSIDHSPKNSGEGRQGNTSSAPSEDDLKFECPSVASDDLSIKRAQLDVASHDCALNNSDLARAVAAIAAEEESLQRGGELSDEKYMKPDRIDVASDDCLAHIVAAIAAEEVLQQAHDDLDEKMASVEQKMSPVLLAGTNTATDEHERDPWDALLEDHLLADGDAKLEDISDEVFEVTLGAFVGSSTSHSNPAVSAPISKCIGGVRIDEPAQTKTSVVTSLPGRSWADEREDDKEDSSSDIINVEAILGDDAFGSEEELPL